MNHHDHNNNAKKEALRRLAIVQGHLEKVKKMLEEDAYCPDIIHQSRAVQAALQKIDEKILDGHLHTCVLEDIKDNGVQSEKVVDEIMEIFKKQR